MTALQKILSVTNRDHIIITCYVFKHLRGEDYDARLEQDGWSTPGFNDSEWRKALTVNSPGGAMSLKRPSFESDGGIRSCQNF